MAQILKEEKYPDGSLKSRETELHDQSGQQVILKEAWYPSGVDPLAPDAQQPAGQQQYKENYVNGQKHGSQEGWHPSGVDPSDPTARQRGGQQQYKCNYVNGQLHGLQEGWYPSRVDPSNPWQATDSAQQRGGRQKYKENYVNGQEHGVQECWYDNGQQQYKKYYLDGVEVSQEIYQAYIKGLAPTIQATVDFGERGISEIIAGYLLP
jgi:antitoxin component YwqK of YwqJK toxin-antitoxin module